MSESLTDKLQACFLARPNTWIDGRELATIAGSYGWRTRVSNLRKRGFVVENRQRTLRDHEASCPAVAAWDIPEACQCSRQRRWVVSEYRLVVAAQEVA
jgi:hypothetical protein